jgi:hypothetical protein
LIEDLIRDYHDAEPTHLLTLTGIGGIGKSHAAHCHGKRGVEPAYDDFSDGICWGELAETDTADAMLQRIARSSNFGFQPPSLKEQTLDYLCGRHMPLVLTTPNALRRPGTRSAGCSGSLPALRGWSPRAAS